VEIRAQRGDRLRTEGDVRTALAGNAANDAVTPPFAEVTDTLEPGRQVPVQLSMPLRGTGGGTLALQRAGVYELLINVNGSRTAAARRGWPGCGCCCRCSGCPRCPICRGAGGRRSDRRPHPVSMLYPLADRPRRLPTGPGEPVLLGDDQLAPS